MKHIDAAPNKIWINTDTLNGYYMSNHPSCGEEYIRKNALLKWVEGKMTIEGTTEGFIGGYNTALKDVIDKIKS